MRARPAGQKPAYRTHGARWTRSSWSPPPAGGRPGGFDELVRRTYVDTYTLALRLTGNEEDARDVVQEAYLRA